MLAVTINNHKSKLSACLAGSISCFLLVESCFAISFDLRGEYENWNSGLSGTATALLGGFGATHAIDSKLSVGGGLVAGKYGNSADATTDISRFDIDLTASYRLQPLISVYAGYQLIQLDYTNKDDNSRSFDDRSHGFGVGAARYFPLKPRWLLYGGAGLTGVYATSTLNNGSEDVGIGYSSSLNAGVLYSIDKISSVASGFKTRWSSIDYRGDSGKWSHNAIRLVISYSRQW